MRPRLPYALFDARVGSGTTPGIACPQLHCGREPLQTHLYPASSGQQHSASLCAVPCWIRPPHALPNAPLLSLQSIIPLMKFLESELQYLNEHLVQENFER